MNSQRHACKGKQPKTSTSKNTRGATMCKEVTNAMSSGVKFQVEWDEDGQAIGPHAAELTSYIGNTAKRFVAITYGDWGRDVLQALKDMVWKTILMGFILPDQKKDWVLKVANNLWRRFKSDLTTKHMFDINGELCANPPRNYVQYVTLDTWKKFIEIRMSDEFKKSSQEHRELSFKNEYTYRGSRSGYPGIKEKMKKELGTSNISRAVVWKRARLQKDGAFSPKVKEVVDKMVILSEQASLGEIEISGRQDILSRALEKKEHLGCVRGVGQYVTMTEYYGHASQGLSTSDADVARAVKEIEEKMDEKVKDMEQKHTDAQAQILEMQEFIVTLLQKMNKDMPQLSLSIPQFGRQVPQVSDISTDAPSSVLPYTSVNSQQDLEKSNKKTQTKLVKESVMNNESVIHPPSKTGSPIEPSSTTPSVMFDNQDFVPCNLFWPNMGQQVAVGSVYCSNSKVRLHNRALDPGCFIVQVITPIQGMGELELPRPIDEARTVFEAVGTFVAWPIELVSTTMGLKKNQKITPKTKVDRTQ